MAELPEIGKQCSISWCAQLDYTPHFCKHCEQHFCGEHRFAHACVPSASVQWDGIKKESAPVKPYLCSQTGCHQAESVKIVCPKCMINYCLKHRHADTHNCVIEPNKEDIVNQKMQEIREKLDLPRESACTTQPPKSSTIRKVLSDAERKKMEKIGLMRLKTTLKGIDIPPNSQRFLYVTIDDATVEGSFLMVDENWMVGRCADAAISKFGFTNQNADVWGKKRRLYPLNSSDPLPFDKTIAQLLTFNENKVAYLELKLDP